MACCGGGQRGATRPKPEHAARPFAPVTLVYTGGTALTAIGGGTGHCYRFGHPGAALAVHPRDAPGLLAIPALRRAG